MNRTIKYITIPLNKTSSKIDDLLAEKDKVDIGASILLLVGILYTITVGIAAVKEISIVVEPFLPIPKEKYYFWEIFFTIPVFFIAVITFSGTARFIAHLLGGQGDFESIFSIYSIVTVIPLLLTMWIPETMLILLKDVSLSDYKVVIPLFIDIPRQIIGVIWPLFPMAMGIKKVERINIVKSIVITLLAFIPYTALIITFIR